MSASLEKARKAIEKIARNNKIGKLAKEVKNKSVSSTDDALKSDEKVNVEGQKKRLETIADLTGKSYSVLRTKED